MAEHNFLSIRETARKYGLSERFLRQLEHTGRLPGFYSGKCKRVNIRLLMEQLDNESAVRGRCEE